MVDFQNIKEVMKQDNNQGYYFFRNPYFSGALQGIEHFGDQSLIDKVFVSVNNGAASSANRYVMTHRHYGNDYVQTSREEVTEEKLRSDPKYAAAMLSIAMQTGFPDELEPYVEAAKKGVTSPDEYGLQLHQTVKNTIKAGFFEKSYPQMQSELRETAKELGFAGAQFSYNPHQKSVERLETVPTFTPDKETSFHRYFEDNPLYTINKEYDSGRERSLMLRPKEGVRLEKDTVDMMNRIICGNYGLPGVIRAARSSYGNNIDSSGFCLDQNYLAQRMNDLHFNDAFHDLIHPKTIDFLNKTPKHEKGKVIREMKEALEVGMLPTYVKNQNILRDNDQKDKIAQKEIAVFKAMGNVNETLGSDQEIFELTPDSKRIQFTQTFKDREIANYIGARINQALTANNYGLNFQSLLDGQSGFYTAGKLRVVENKRSNEFHIVFDKVNVLNLALKENPNLKENLEAITNEAKQLVEQREAKKHNAAKEAEEKPSGKCKGPCKLVASLRSLMQGIKNSISGRGQG